MVPEPASHGGLGGGWALEVGGLPHVDSWQSPPRFQGVPGAENYMVPSLAHSPTLSVKAVGAEHRMRFS